MENNAVKSAVSAPVMTEEAKKAAEFKAKKKEAADRFKENQKKRKAQVLENAKLLKEELTKMGTFAKLSASAQKFINELIVPPANVAAQGTILSTLFGDTPKVGDKITLGEAFSKTFKGKATLDIYFRRIEKERGIKVGFKQDKEMIKSVYEIISLGANDNPPVKAEVKQ